MPANLKFYRSKNGQVLKKTGGKKNELIGSKSQKNIIWIEISSSEYYWRRKLLLNQKLSEGERLSLVESLAAQGEEAVHEYCLKRYGHGSKGKYVEFVGGV